MSRPLLLTEILSDVALSEASPPLIFLSPESSEWRIHTSQGPEMPTIKTADEKYEIIENRYFISVSFLIF